MQRGTSLTGIKPVPSLPAKPCVYHTVAVVAAALAMYGCAKVAATVNATVLCRTERRVGYLSQLCAMGYFAKISSTRLNAISAATCGASPPCIMSVQPKLQTCSAWTWA
jgi:hypothetical protein